MIGRLAFVSLLVGMTGRPVAGAQVVSGGIEAGAVKMRYADSVDATAAALTPSLRIESGNATLGAAATYSQFSSGEWSGQGTVAGSVFTPRSGPLAGEVAGFFGGSAHQDGGRTTQTLGIGRLHLLGEAGGVWAGGGLGAAWDGAVWRSVRQGEAGAWARISDSYITATFAPVVVEDSIRYSDSKLAYNMAGPRIELSATAGFRSGDRLPTPGGSARSWGSASVAVWLTRSIGIVGSAGMYPVDFTQGFPGGRFASLGLRLSSVRVRTSAAESRASLITADPEIAMPSRAEVRELRISSVSAGMRTITVDAVAKRSVEIAGDFTDWKPVPLTSDGSGQWSVLLPIGSGMHEINVRVDGGQWLVPSGLASSRDEFGGSVGILIVR